MRKLYLIFIIISLISLQLNGQNKCLDKHIPVIISNKLLDGNQIFLLDFSDDFKGDSLNTNKWKAIKGVPRDENFIYSKQFYSPQNIVVNNGILSLQAREENLIDKKYSLWVNNKGMVEYSNDFRYTSGEIVSKEQFHYGIYEIRCKLPIIKDLFPAFWMFSGPYWNEIDVFEYKNQKLWGLFKRPKYSSRKMLMNSYFNFERDEKVYTCKESINTRADLNKFHVYTLIFTPYDMYWLFDYEYVRKTSYLKDKNGDFVTGNNINNGERYYLNKSYPEPLINIIANLAIQTDEIKKGQTLDFPVSYDIDYIKYYKMYSNMTDSIPIRPFDYAVDSIYLPINNYNPNKVNIKSIKVDKLIHDNFLIVLDLYKEKYLNVEIYDANNELVFQENKVKKYIYKVDIENFESGEYRIEVKNKSNQIINQIKFSI